jgi:hypothetical protein
VDQRSDLVGPRGVIPVNQVYQHVPYGIWTIPEISMVGETEQALLARGVPIIVGRAQDRQNARGMVLADPFGMVKLIFSAVDLALLGIHIIGEDACELSRPGPRARVSRRRGVWLVAGEGEPHEWRIARSIGVEGDVAESELPLVVELHWKADDADAAGLTGLAWQHFFERQAFVSGLIAVAGEAARRTSEAAGLPDRVVSPLGYEWVGHIEAHAGEPQLGA